MPARGGNGRRFHAGHAAAGDKDGAGAACRPQREAALPSRIGIDGAHGRPVLEELHAALVAGDAAHNLVLAPGQRLRKDLGVGVKGAAHMDEVAVAAGDCFFGRLHVVDTPRADNRDANGLLDLARQRHEHAARHVHRLDQRFNGLIKPCRDVHIVQTKRFQPLEEADRIVDSVTALDFLSHRQAKSDRHRIPEFVAHRLIDFDQEAPAILVAAAIFVVTPVHHIGKKIADQIAMGAMDSDHVIPGLGRPPGAGAIALLDIGDA